MQVFSKSESIMGVFNTFLLPKAGIYFKKLPNRFPFQVSSLLRHSKKTLKNKSSDDCEYSTCGTESYAWKRLRYLKINL